MQKDQQSSHRSLEVFQSADSSRDKNKPKKFASTKQETIPRENLQTNEQISESQVTKQNASPSAQWKKWKSFLRFL